MRKFRYVIKYEGKVVRKGSMYADSSIEAEEILYQKLFDEAKVEKECVDVKVYFKDFGVTTCICEDWKDIIRSALEKIDILVIDEDSLKLFGGDE